MNETNELPEVIMPHCPNRNLLQGQKALVTGARSGIGKSVAIHLAQEGAEVIINYIGDEQAASEVVKTIKSRGGNAIAIKADVSKEDQVQSMFKQRYLISSTTRFS